MPTITLNGQPHTLETPLSISKLMETLRLEPNEILIEVNNALIKKEQWETHTIQTNDDIEILHFMGGGAH